MFQLHHCSLYVSKFLPQWLIIPGVDGAYKIVCVSRNMVLGATNDLSLQFGVGA
jgi:hypothetical protein